MKAELDTNNDRIIVLQDLDVQLVDMAWQIDTFRLKMDYDGDTGVGNAKVLDKYVIPKLLALMQLEEHLPILRQLAEENMLTEKDVNEAEDGDTDAMEEMRQEQLRAVESLSEYLATWCEA